MRMFVDARQQTLSEAPELARQLDHDVRTPLTTICGYAECLAGNKPQPQYARNIVVQARRLERLVAYHALLAERQVEEEPTPVVLSEALQQALADLAETAQLLGVTVRVEPLREEAVLLWHPATLHRLLVAVLEVMLETVGEKAEVRVCPVLEGGEVVLSVHVVGQKLPVDTRRFPFRAVARLVGTRGGSVLVHDGPEAQLCVRVPLCGRLVSEASLVKLEKSA